MNKNLKSLTVEKLMFKHKCINEEKFLTAAEKFKLTPMYQEILKKQKAAKEAQEAKERGEELKKDEIEENKNQDKLTETTKRTSKRVQKM